MKTEITVEKWGVPRDLMLKNYQAILEPDSDNRDLVKCKITFEVDMYNLKIVKGLNGLHLVNDSDEGRLPYEMFMSLLKELKRVGSCKCVWDIYPGQPVWEFNWLEGTLGHKIKEISPLINVEYV